MSGLLSGVVSDMAASADALAHPDPLSMSHSLIAVIGLALVAVGTRYLFNPGAALQEFGLEHSTSEPPVEQPLTVYTGLIGARDVLVGSLLLVLGQWVDSAVVGYVVLAVMALPVMDAAMAWRHKAEKGKVVSHLGVAGLCSLLAYVLLKQGK